MSSNILIPPTDSVRNLSVVSNTSLTTFDHILSHLYLYHTHLTTFDHISPHIIFIYRPITHLSLCLTTSHLISSHPYLYLASYAFVTFAEWTFTLLLGLGLLLSSTRRCHLLGLLLSSTRRCHLLGLLLSSTRPIIVIYSKFDYINYLFSTFLAFKLSVFLEC